MLRSNGRRFLAGTIATFTLLAWPAGTGLAGAREGTRCTFAYVITLSPGLSTEGSSGTVTTNGPTGKLDCDGPVNGRKPNGEGTIGISGNYGTTDSDSCTSGLVGGGEGAGSTTLAVPTRGGEQVVTDGYALTYGQTSSKGVVSGAFEGERYSGTFDLHPLEGDCVTRPITKVLVTGEGFLTEAA
jgi:hypothetical protein